MIIDVPQLSYHDPVAANEAREKLIDQIKLDGELTIALINELEKFNIEIQLRSDLSKLYRRHRQAEADRLRQIKFEEESTRQYELKMLAVLKEKYE